MPWHVTLKAPHRRYPWPRLEHWLGELAGNKSCWTNNQHSRPALGGNCTPSMFSQSQHQASCHKYVKEQDELLHICDQVCSIRQRKHHCLLPRTRGCNLDDWLLSQLLPTSEQIALNHQQWPIMGCSGLTCTSTSVQRILIAEIVNLFGPTTCR